MKYFEGTPIPTSVLIVAVMAVLHSQGRLEPAIWLRAVAIRKSLTLHPLTLIYFLSGSAMSQHDSRAQALSEYGPRNRRD